MSLVKDAAPTGSALISTCLLDIRENGSFPTAQACRGIKAGTAFNPLAPRSISPPPLHPEYTLTALLWTLNLCPPCYDLLQGNSVKSGALQDCLYILAASATDFLVLTRWCKVIVRKETWCLNPVGTGWYFLPALAEHRPIVTPFENPTGHIVPFYAGRLHRMQLSYWEFRYTDTSPQLKKQM